MLPDPRKLLLTSQQSKVLQVFLSFLTVAPSNLILGVRNAQGWASEDLCGLGQVCQPLWASSDTLWQLG